MRFSQALLSACRRIASTLQEDRFQTSLLKPVTRSGVGLHSGREATVTIFPSHAGRGRYFTLENGGGVEVPASAGFVVDNRLSTCLGRDGFKVRTVEHLLSALESLCVDNCRIHLEGNDEVPLLDGSALPWIEVIDEAGVVVAKDENGSLVQRLPSKLNHPVYVTSPDESFVAAFPASDTEISYGIDFPEYPAIGKQWFVSSITPERFRNDIGPARTFGLYEQFETLRATGLIKGGSLENALVCSKEKGWLNPPLRFPNEPCRHKLLDILGDLSLCSQGGNPGLPIARIIAYKASHALHVRFCKALLQQNVNSTVYERAEVKQ